MKPAAFDYVAPRSLDEALTVLVERGDEAKVLAGGQSLVPLLNMRLARPGILIDLNRLPGLDYVRIDDGGIAIGALTRQRAIERSDLARSRAPLLVAATGYIGHPAIRNRGTVGGSLAHGDPVSELPCVAVALDATIVATSPAGDRAISAGDFFSPSSPQRSSPTRSSPACAFRACPSDPAAASKSWRAGTAISRSLASPRCCP